MLGFFKFGLKTLLLQLSHQSESLVCLLVLTVFAAFLSETLSFSRFSVFLTAQLCEKIFNKILDYCSHC